MTQTVEKEASPFLKKREILAAQHLLLRKALADWPRRAAPLLAVNCGSGEFLPFLWQAGFDLMATEADGRLRDAARKAQVPGIAIYASEDADLPFENESFDWVFVNLRSGEKERLEAASAEAFRVARRGIMLAFWNENSLPLLLWRFLHRQKWPEPAANWRKVWRAAKGEGGCKITGLAILPGPVGSWGLSSLFAWLNRQVSFLPLGAWAIVRVDFQGATPLTPMPLRIDSGMAELERNMEWAHKRDSNSHRKNGK